MIINFDDIIDVFPKKRTIVFRTGDPNSPINPIKLKKKDFDICVYKFKRLISSREDPEERWEPFEVNNEHGVFCFDKLQKLLKLRRKGSDNASRK